MTHDARPAPAGDEIVLGDPPSPPPPPFLCLTPLQYTLLCSQLLPHCHTPRPLHHPSLPPPSVLLAPPPSDACTSSVREEAPARVVCGRRRPPPPPAWPMWVASRSPSHPTCTGGGFKAEKQRYWSDCLRGAPFPLPETAMVNRTVGIAWLPPLRSPCPLVPGCLKQDEQRLIMITEPAQGAAGGTPSRMAPYSWPAVIIFLVEAFRMRSSPPAVLAKAEGKSPARTTHPEHARRWSTCNQLLAATRVGLRGRGQGRTSTMDSCCTTAPYPFRTLSLL